MEPGLVLQARERIRPYIAQTPVCQSAEMNQAAGAQIFFKCENLQYTGAFKLRGAFNFLLQLSPEQLRRGVVAFSSGNHAQAVAWAARELGATADLVMPSDAPAIKIERVRQFGGRVHLYARSEQSREGVAAKLVAESGATLVPPFDDERIIAGAGTAALELIETVPDLDLILCPVGGGGLISGTALAAQLSPRPPRLIGVEPQTAADCKLSLERGVISAIAENPTIADGLRTIQPVELTFPIIQRYVNEIRTVSDEEMRSAVRKLLLEMKLLVEPSGAAAAAAVWQTRWEPYEKVGVILSGGNLDPKLLCNYLQEAQAQR